MVLFYLYMKGDKEGSYLSQGCKSESDRHSVIGIWYLKKRLLVNVNCAQEERSYVPYVLV